MDQVITFTLSDLWNFVLALCAMIAALSGAVTIIVKIVQKVKSPGRKLSAEVEEIKKQMDQKTDGLNNRLDKVEKRLDEGSEQFKKEEQRATDIEEEVRDTTKMIVKSLQALMAHEIDGNNIEELKQAKKDIDNYLLEKV